MVRMSDGSNLDVFESDIYIDQTGAWGPTGPSTITLTGLGAGTIVDLYIYGAPGHAIGQDGQFVFGATTKTTSDATTIEISYVENVNYVKFATLVADGSGTITGTWTDIGGQGSTLNGLQLQVSPRALRRAARRPRHALHPAPPPRVSAASVCGVSVREKGLEAPIRIFLSFSTSDLFIHFSPRWGQVGALGGHSPPDFEFASGGAIPRAARDMGFRVPPAFFWQPHGLSTELAVRFSCRSRLAGSLIAVGVTRLAVAPIPVPSFQQEVL